MTRLLHIQSWCTIVPTTEIVVVYFEDIFCLWSKIPYSIFCLCSVLFYMFVIFFLIYPAYFLNFCTVFLFPLLICINWHMHHCFNAMFYTYCKFIYSTAVNVMVLFAVWLCPYLPFSTSPPEVLRLFSLFVWTGLSGRKLIWVVSLKDYSIQISFIGMTDQIPILPKQYRKL